MLLGSAVCCQRGYRSGVLSVPLCLVRECCVLSESVRERCVLSGSITECCALSGRVLNCSVLSGRVINYMFFVVREGHVLLCIVLTYCMLSDGVYETDFIEGQF